jgi:hypothetical protein
MSRRRSPRALWFMPNLKRVGRKVIIEFQTEEDARETLAILKVLRGR